MRTYLYVVVVVFVGLAGCTNERVNEKTSNQGKNNLANSEDLNGSIVNKKHIFHADCRGTLYAHLQYGTRVLPMTVKLRSLGMGYVQWRLDTSEVTRRSIAKVKDSKTLVFYGGTEVKVDQDSTEFDVSWATTTAQGHYQGSANCERRQVPTPSIKGDAALIGGTTVPDCIDEVPIPRHLDVLKARPAPDVPDKYSRFWGAYIGKWGKILCSALVVTHIDKEGKVQGLYAWGDSKDFDPGVVYIGLRYDARIVGDTLRGILPNGIEVEFIYWDTESLRAFYDRGGSKHSVTVFFKATEPNGIK